jgi:hypothetical protein
MGSRLGIALALAGGMAHTARANTTNATNATTGNCSALAVAGLGNGTCGLKVGAWLNSTTFRCIPPCMGAFANWDGACGGNCSSGSASTNTSCGFVPAACTGTATNRTATPNCTAAFLAADAAGSSHAGNCATGCTHSVQHYDVFGDALNPVSADVATMRMGVECFSSAFLAQLGSSSPSHVAVAALRPPAYASACATRPTAGGVAPLVTLAKCVADAPCTARIEHVLIEGGLRCGQRWPRFNNCSLLSLTTFPPLIASAAEVRSLDNCINAVWDDTNNAAAVLAGAVSCAAVPSYPTDCVKAKSCTNWRAACGASAPLTLFTENKSWSGSDWKSSEFHCSEGCAASFLPWHEGCNQAVSVPKLDEMSHACSATALRTWMRQQPACSKQSAACDADSTCEEQLLPQLRKELKTPHCATFNPWEVR